MEVVCLFLNRVWNLSFVVKTYTDCVCRKQATLLVQEGFQKLFIVSSGLLPSVRRQTEEGTFVTKLLQTDTHADKK